MKQILITLLALSFTINLFSQKRHPGKSYVAWVDFYQSSHKYKGILYDVKDSSIVLSKDYLIPSKKIQTFNAKDIKNLKIRRTANMGRGLAFGALLGTVAGGIIGYAFGDDPPCQTTTTSSYGINFTFGFCIRKTAGDKALIGAVSGSVAGGLLGLIIGSKSISIPIAGKSSKLKAEKERLKKIAIIK